MAKVVLVWNEHPTEVVAGFHARRVAKILREKYGHEVIVEKIPPGETNYGIVRRENPKQAAKKLAKLPSSFSITARYAKKHDTFAFNFHASIVSQLGDANAMAPEHFRVGTFKTRELSPDSPYPSEIAIEGNPTARHYIVELPGVYSDIGKRIRERNREQVKRVFKQLFSLKQRLSRRAIGETNPGYHYNATKLAPVQQKKYLHPVISEKIAAAIHERVTKK